MMKLVSLGFVFIYLLNYDYHREQRIEISFSFHEQVWWICGSQHKEYRPFENLYCFINAGLFPPSNEKEMILKASNSLKQKLFTEDLKKNKNKTKSMLSLKIMGMSLVKVEQEKGGF